MILDSFADKFSYEILEGNKERVGGRLFTHKFPGGGPNDYYDVGAMRFPDIPFMTRTFDLFKRLGIDTIPYILSIPKNLNLVNGKLLTNAEIDGKTDPFETHVPVVDQSSSAMVSSQIDVFKDALAKDFEAGWKELMQFDEYSTRAYMLFHGNGGVTYTNPVPLVSFHVVDYLETFESATNLYDEALTETVMDSMDFDYPGQDVQWHCIQGGTEQVAQKMEATLSGNPVHKGKRVTALSFDNPSAPTAVRVSVSGDDTPRTYEHVVTSVPFGCLRAIDTSACGFSWPLQSAMRMLHYDAATKVAIRFSSRWWEAPGIDQLGGVSNTDRPTRVVVYPSYGMGQQTGASMIVSYTWSQDALRLGALIEGKDSTAEAHLIDLILEDLAAMHSIDKAKLAGLLLDYHAFDWYNHEFSAGAFALLGPGQFANLYPEVTRPAHGRLHFAGEATSVHHAWLVGALNSAYRAVKEILLQYDDEDHSLIKKLEKEWGRIDEIDDELHELQVRLGRRQFGGSPSA
ncbi:hypothetical protein AURDEDRAFT_89618 [Auricularia subglabra TFB-10046 SS5]|nr:hypothetical protein AURDEDRAFT_89618 [Auricularia subglabra TFB-10046 SS5]